MDNQQQQIGIMPPVRSVGELLWLALGLVGIGLFGAWMAKALFGEEWERWIQPS